MDRDSDKGGEEGINVSPGEVEKVGQVLEKEADTDDPDDEIT